MRSMLEWIKTGNVSDLAEADKEPKLAYLDKFRFTSGKYVRDEWIVINVRGNMATVRQMFKNGVGYQEYNLDLNMAPWEKIGTVDAADIPPKRVMKHYKDKGD